MFIQVIEGHTSDPMALHRQSDAWHREIEPGAIGYLGSTGGVTSDGDAIFVVRFESVDAESVRRAFEEAGMSFARIVETHNFFPNEEDQ